jgi:hypothetical protein
LQIKQKKDLQTGIWNFAPNLQYSNAPPKKKVSQFPSKRLWNRSINQVPLDQKADVSNINPSHHTSGLCPFLSTAFIVIAFFNRCQNTGLP